MPRTVTSVYLPAFVSLLLLSPLTGAQEGHPYEGTWRGTISNGDSRAVVIIMDYDGEELNGMINPGRSSYQFQDVMHDAPSWTLQVSAETRDGEPVGFTAVMHEIGSVNRYMEGTWTEGGQEYDFRITRE